MVLLHRFFSVRLAALQAFAQGCGHAHAKQDSVQDRHQCIAVKQRSASLASLVATVISMLHVLPSHQSTSLSCNHQEVSFENKQAGSVKTFSRSFVAWLREMLLRIFSEEMPLEPSLLTLLSTARSCYHP
jgi:hypothetical protein